MTLAILILALIVPCARLQAAEAPATEPPSALAGRVLDLEGRRVFGATVRALALEEQAAGEPLAGKTAPDGTFSFEGQHAGAWRVRVEAQGFAPWNDPRVAGRAPLEIRLRPGRRVVGRIVDASSGKGVPRARVRLIDA